MGGGGGGEQAVDATGRWRGQADTSGKAARNYSILYRFWTVNDDAGDVLPARHSSIYPVVSTGYYHINNASKEAW